MHSSIHWHLCLCPILTRKKSFFSKFWVIDLSMKCRVSNLCIFRVPLIPLMINLEPSLKPFKRNTFPTHASDITAILYCFCFDSIDNICKWKRSLEPCPVALCEISCGKKVTTNVLRKKKDSKVLSSDWLDRFHAVCYRSSWLYILCSLCSIAFDISLLDCIPETARVPSLY